MQRTLFAAAALLAGPLALAQSTVVAVDIDNVIHPITVEILDSALADAREQNADLILLRLNTPGGLLDSTREITERIVSSDIPVVTYVTPSGGRAASAGFFILVAGDVAAMAPGTNTGAASPVLMGQEMDPVMRSKVENDTAAALRTIVEKRGRNVELAEKAVMEAEAFTEKEALDNNLIDLVVPSEEELFQQLNGREIERFSGETQTLALDAPRVVDYKLTTRQSFIAAIANPNIAFIILVLGALGVYVEFSSPGMIVPGVAGGILVLLGLSALSVLPINWIGVALLLLAVALFVMEGFVASHGVLAIGGAVSMVLGALLLVDGPPSVQIRLSTAIAVTLPFALISAFLVTLIVQARKNKVVTGTAGMVGGFGLAHTALSPAGRVFVHGEYWEAVSSTPVEAGSRVKIIKVDGLKLNVEPESPEGRENNAD